MEKEEAEKNLVCTIVVTALAFMMHATYYLLYDANPAEDTSSWSRCSIFGV